MNMTSKMKITSEMRTFSIMKTTTLPEKLLITPHSAKLTQNWEIEIEIKFDMMKEIFAALGMNMHTCSEKTTI